jgi:2-C-methyl-D-erythritol 4-phosphate cytidylyltransferase/2-C-methyl-D-erythritol 2,4-cyclodiphosphate synthase
MFVTAIVAAGGRGLRLGGARPKQLLVVGGRSLLERSVDAFLTHPLVDQLVVALPADLAEAPPPYLRDAVKPVRVVSGGDRRQDSVANAFQAIDDRAELVVVHDAARPFASANLIDRTIAAAAEVGAAVAALQARDTVKQGEAGIVRATLPRESIFLAQTPQAFRRAVLRDALALGAQGVEATDEATLAERAGHTVRLVEGEASNIKVTTADDLPIAEAIAIGRRDGPWPVRAGEDTVVRVGLGYDLHRLVDGRPLILGGVTIPFERGLTGHSDADAVCHAVTDAVLGAAAARDIGWHFPDTDPRWRDASSLDLLARAVETVRGQRYGVVNVDVVVIAERPKLGPYVDAMRANVATALGIAIEAVSIKGKTNEGVGDLGRGEAIAVHAMAAVRSVEPRVES